ncbi:nuclear transport factor 2 family protein [Luteipulveratus halotolerans]|uniref:Serine/arginine repetitive matrix protein 1 n=1 Tax=Luteipulveratus halotolerans TaxID=1631356 RepID=A0A0L6CM45_9MICO|nr:nuclear transport factor 2 family protein [Luteipulveratus halotolerans]KNX38804.1 serine/arginine repetitive matrix protein 1 [Luteipulveratus halotolerans]
MTNHVSDPAAAFRAGVEAGDLDAMAATLHDDVRLYSPVKFQPFEGKAAVVELFGVLLRTFEDFRYVGALAGQVEPAFAGADAHEADVLIFRATVQGKEIHGMDMLNIGPSGLIEEFTVMVRPMTATQTLGQAVLDGFATTAD